MTKKPVVRFLIFWGVNTLSRWVANELFDSRACIFHQSEQTRGENENKISCDRTDRRAGVDFGSSECPELDAALPRGALSVEMGRNG